MQICKLTQLINELTVQISTRPYNHWRISIGGHQSLKCNPSPPPNTLNAQCIHVVHSTTDETFSKFNKSIINDDMRGHPHSYIAVKHVLINVPRNIKFPLGITSTQ